MRVRGRTVGDDRHATAFVNAAGPLAPEVGRLLGVELPLFNELHGKVTFDDTSASCRATRR